MSLRLIKIYVIGRNSDNARNARNEHLYHQVQSQFIAHKFDSESLLSVLICHCQMAYVRVARARARNS